MVCKFNRAGREHRGYLFYCFPLTPLFGTGTPENNKKLALRAFRTQKYRVAIECFSFANLSTAKEKYLFFAPSAPLR